MSKNSSISTSVIKRLPRYYRFLGELLKQNIVRISSRELSEKMNITASQIRQDLNCFGGFGQQGYGYNVDDLHTEIGKILGVDKAFKTILIGAGNLGKAVALHMNFADRGCELIGIFDSNESIVGTEVSDQKIRNISGLERFCDIEHPDLAILCIPKTAAQDIVDKLVSYGLKAFWNFSHYDLQANYKHTVVENVHLGDSLLTLTYRINNIEKEEL